MLHGCSGDVDLSGTVKVEQDINVAAATGTITGRVIDATTAAPIEAADVTLIVNGAKRTTTSATSTDEDLKGYFVFSGVPAGDHLLTISATGYADYADMVPVTATDDNTPYTENVGWIGLGKTFDLAVVVTDEDGTLVEGVTVRADGPASVCTGFDVGGGYATAVTGSDGIATFSALNQCSSYIIVAAAFDADADGVYDYQTTTVAYDGAIDTDTTVSLVLTTAERDDDIATVAESWDSNEQASFNTFMANESFPGANGTITLLGTYYSIGTDDSIKIIFNYPVSLGDLSVSYVDDLIDPDADDDGAEDTGYDDEILVDVTASMDSTGTILTITPPTAGFERNELIDIEWVVDATVDGATDYLALSMELYIEDDTATGLSSTTTITADNYNGDSDGAVAAAVVIEFPEYVYGTIRVISEGVVGSHAAGTQDILYLAAVEFGTGTIVWTDGDVTTTVNAVSGKTLGRFYTVPTARTLKDTDEIKVEVNVTDVVGTRYHETKLLTVD